MVELMDFGSPGWSGGGGHGGSLAIYNTKLNLSLGYAGNAFHLQGPTDYIALLESIVAKMP